MRDVYVAGVAMIRFGRYPERDVPDLGAEAVLGALKDAGLSIKDVELMAAGCLFQANAMVGQRILQEVGQTSIPRSEEHTSELQSLAYLVCRLLLEKKKIQQHDSAHPW